MKRVWMALACASGTVMAGNAIADGASEIDLLKQQMAIQQQQIQEMAASQKALQAKLDALAAAAPAALPSKEEAPVSRSALVVPTPGAGGHVLSARVLGTDVSLYGFVDVSADSANNGKQHIYEVSSNESFLGVRGGKDLGSTGIRAVFQIETLAEVSGTPGAGSAFGSRNSFGGFETRYGSLLAGKYDTPYKASTALMDPFAGSVGDYNSIMGNTAGEGRAEFDYRMPHSIFYLSPSIYGFTINALYSPGQKLNNLGASVNSASNYAFPQGELVCSGSQQPSLNGAAPNGTGSGATSQTLCNDGAFKDAYSISLNYNRGPLTAVAAWERHKGVDRTSDAGGLVADEAAFKIAGSYLIPIGNQVSVIYEKFYRYGIPAAGNERQRDGYYISDVQDLTHGLDFMAAYAHADQTAGSPKFPGLPDAVDMYTAGLRYNFDKQINVYVIGAYLAQQAGAHYGLGAGEGHGTPVLSPRTTGGGPLPGLGLEATSMGFQIGF